MLELTIFQLLLLIGLGNAVILLLSFTQIEPKYRRPALFLGLFIVGYLLYQANFMIIPEVQRHVSFIVPGFPVLLFLPALFLFFVESTFNPNFRIKGRYLLFLVPGMIDVVQHIASWIMVHFITSGPVYAFITGPGRHFTIEGFGILFSLICLWFVMKRLLSSDFKKTRAYHFYRFVIAGMTFILLYWIVLFFTALLAPGFYNVTIQYYLWVFDSVFLLYTGYKLLVSPKILKTSAGGFALPNKDKTSELSEQLRQLLSEKKLYLNPNLTRKELAEALNVSEVFISSLLNEGLKTSFYELINRYRVEEAMRLIRSGELNRITVEALAKEAGFKSKSTFNKAFRQHTGTTPTKFHAKL